MTKLLYTPLEAAQALGMSRTGFYRLISSGEVESVKIGNRRRIPVAAVERYVEALRAEQADHDGTDAEPQPTAS